MLLLIVSQKKTPKTDELPKFAIVGRPNAGKSSLVNALMGKNKNIVTSIAGTTRDSIALTTINLVMNLHL